MNFSQIQRVYFIGIGGIGMSALARYFKYSGKTVAGYDKTPSQLTRELEGEGITIHYDTDPELIPGEFKNTDHISSTIIIITPAIPNDHPCLQYFQQHHFSIIKRAQALGIITDHLQCIAISGTHGKTTTTSCTAHLLNQTSGCNAFLGGIASNYGTNLLLNKDSNLVVVEADEFDRSFLTLKPKLAVITSIDADHLDIYGTHDEVIKAFNQFVQCIIPGGTLLIKAQVRKYIPYNNAINFFTYSIDGNAGFHPVNVRLINGLYTFDLATPQGIFHDFTLGIPGLYNLENAVAALACCILTDVPVDKLRSPLRSFTGVRRRFDIRINTPSKVLIDDYAHHPAEIKACIHSARQLFVNRHITGIFQPHLFSRTRDFYEEFAAELSQLDRVILLPVYPARELPLPGISSEIIFDKIANSDKMLIPFENLIQELRSLKTDIIITMGAGNIDTLVPELEKIYS